ncbi:g8639 [Coccomyxa viridis]|uniref:G8639 protein n=1 Tax=Coccomyxa viridis TaxID=1274662 RepID=A0ABP1G0V0_9CHLO
MGSSHPYFAKGQRNPLESCDILLKLDDGTELPAHIQVLARCMPIFDDMLAGGPLAKASMTNVVRVPFSDCSLEEARHFLAAIYSIEASEYIDERSALSRARLSHKYGGEHMVRLCDNALARTAGIDSDNFVKFPSYLEDQDFDKFINIMTSAALFGMPKVLACCEYYVAVDTYKEAHMGLATQTELGASCHFTVLLKE